MLRSLLVSEASFDARAPVAAGVCLGVVVLLACYPPVPRATRVEQAAALRES